MIFDLKSVDPDVVELLDEALPAVEQWASQVSSLRDKLNAVQGDLTSRLSRAEAALAKAQRRVGLILKAGGQDPSLAEGVSFGRIHEGKLFLNEVPPPPPKPEPEPVVEEPVVEEIP